MVTPAPVPVPHVGGPISGPGAPTTLIAGMPAARVGDLAICAGPPDAIVVGSFTVLIEGKPAARMGDTCAHGGTIAAGCPTVLIGNSGGAGSPQAATMGAARRSGAMFTQTHCNLAPAPPETQEPEPVDPLTMDWIEVELVDEAGQPVIGARCRIESPSGRRFDTVTDGQGLTRLRRVEAGEYQVCFPDLDRDAWRPG